MPEETPAKPTKTKGKSRPSFSAPVHAAEPRASAWVDVASSTDVIASPDPELVAEILETGPVAEHTPATPHHAAHEQPHQHPHTAAAEIPAESKSEAKAEVEVAAPTSSRRLRLLPKPRAAYRPQPHAHAEPQTPVRIPDPTPVSHADARPASVSGAMVTGVGIALGLAVIGTYVAFEMLAMPLRLASGLFGSRKSASRTER